MRKLGPIWLDDAVLDAIQADRLVIFAGAGVSMGPPSNLPNFQKLAKDIAAGTGLTLAEHEPVDRFLGRLAAKGVNVWSLAAKELDQAGSRPTDLHVNLLRVFRTQPHVRIVTTNFDGHFESAAATLFGSTPDIFRAPALPLGQDFRGLVHLHGAVTHPSEMVLTDADFGRGYLIQGWARRFLVEVFRTYTVLFVGYSHNDVVLNYLARALPAGGSRRFAITEEDGNWEFLGVTPIKFQLGEGENKYAELQMGIESIAERAVRGALDWQSKISVICARQPPTDDETIGEVERALLETPTTRFLTQIARDQAWPQWLDARSHLASLFDDPKLDERETILAWWLAENYATAYPSEVIGLIARHGMRLNKTFWAALAREVAFDERRLLSPLSLARWVTILLACAPTDANDYVLGRLAQRCTEMVRKWEEESTGNSIVDSDVAVVAPSAGGTSISDANDGTEDDAETEIAQDVEYLGNQRLIDARLSQVILEIFLFMGQQHLAVTTGSSLGDSSGEFRGFSVNTHCIGDHHGLNELWAAHLEPCLPQIAEPLLRGIVRIFERTHHSLEAWNKAARNWDTYIWSRSGIEPHGQDSYPEAADVLIDGARGSLEWLSSSQPALLASWVEILVSSNVPLLRRLAIHGMTLQVDSRPDEQLQWLVKRVGLDSGAEKHETFRAAALAFPNATTPARTAFVKEILRLQSTDSDKTISLDATARVHFNWLTWLSATMTDCNELNEALVPIKLAHPTWRVSEHPDLNHWSTSGVMGPQSPLSTEQLLSSPPATNLATLLNFESDSFHGPDRNGLCAAVQDATKQKPSWGFQLADLLITEAKFDSDLWGSILRGLQAAELTQANWEYALSNYLGRSELVPANAHEIASFLYALVRDGGKPFAMALLPQANVVAETLWAQLPREDEAPLSDWLLTAINRPSGIIAEFWIRGLSLSVRGVEGEARILPENYRTWLTSVAVDQSIAGSLGRIILTSQIAFLFSLDSEWTREHLIPLFTSPNREEFERAWRGYLSSGRIDTKVIDELRPVIISQFSRIADSGQRERFIEFFTALTMSQSEDPLDSLLPPLFQHGSLEDRILFAGYVKSFLRRISDADKSALWERWLRQYWQRRLDSVPAPLQEGEIREMLGWLPLLGPHYPDGVEFAIQIKAIDLGDTFFSYTLSKSDLVSKFSTATAKLLIYLCGCRLGHHGREVGVIAGQLVDLDTELDGRVKEALAQAGVEVIFPA